MNKKTWEKIPEETKKNIEAALGKEELKDFINALDLDWVQGLRVNTLKISVSEFLKIAPFDLKPVPWTDNGFYYEKKERPGKHPFHYAGLYYLQEPSAMLPAKLLAPEKESLVLDLCAAPGGKSTQLGEMMENQGCIFVNDISPKRTLAMAGNIVRMGLRNVVLCNSKPETFAKDLEGFFTHIIIDAPCSGEGMFRRDPSAIDDLSLYSVDECQISQREILETAYRLLKNNGKLLYSTCTFNRKENEDNLQWLEEKFSLKILDTKRIWPHKDEGEGQFAALMQKKDEYINETAKEKVKIFKNSIFEEFILETITEEYRNVFDFSRIVDKDGKLYQIPESFPIIKKINVLRPGWFLGELKKNRFEPSPDLPLALPGEAFKRKIDFSPEEPEVVSYLKGETLMKDFPDKGWTVITVSGFPLGWVKKDGAFLKNYYPKNMRRMD